MSWAPVASASGITRSPPTTSDSLLASATSMPSVSATTVGPSPAEPTIALSTRSAPDSATSRTSPSGPASTSPSVHASAARAAASASPSAIRSTPCSSASATSCSCERSADRPTSSNSSPARGDDVERLEADRAGRAEDQQPFHRRSMMAASGNPGLRQRHYQGCRDRRRARDRRPRRRPRRVRRARRAPPPALLRACRGSADAAQEARADRHRRACAGCATTTRSAPGCAGSGATCAAARAREHAGRTAGRRGGVTPRGARSDRARARPRPPSPRCRPASATRSPSSTSPTSRTPDRGAPRDLRGRRQDPPAQGPCRAAGPPRRPPKGALTHAHQRPHARRRRPRRRRPLTSSCSRSATARAACRSGSAPPRRRARRAPARRRTARAPAPTASPPTCSPPPAPRSRRSASCGSPTRSSTPRPCSTSGAAVDARPSDALNLALVTGAPVLVDEAVLERAAEGEREIAAELEPRSRAERDARAIADDERERAPRCLRARVARARTVERAPEPQPEDRQPHDRRVDPHPRAVEQQVGDEQERRADGDREEAEAGDQQPVARLDQPLALALVEAQPVRRRRGDQAGGRETWWPRAYVEVSRWNAVRSGKRCVNGTVSRNANRICTPGSAIRSSLSSSIICRSRLRSSGVVVVVVDAQTPSPATRGTPRSGRTAPRRGGRARPPWTPNSPPVSFVPTSRLISDSNRSPTGAANATASAEQQPLGAGDPVAVVGAAGVPDRASTQTSDADRQPLPRLVRRHARRQPPRAERAPAEIGAGIAQERAQQHHEDERAAVVEPAQQHGVGEPEADPVDAERGRGEAEGDPLAQRARERERRTAPAGRRRAPAARRARRPAPPRPPAR